MGVGGAVGVIDGIRVGVRVGGVVGDTACVETTGIVATAVGEERMGTGEVGAGSRDDCALQAVKRIMINRRYFFIFQWSGERFGDWPSFPPGYLDYSGYFFVFIPAEAAEGDALLVVEQRLAHVGDGVLREGV